MQRLTFSKRRYPNIRAHVIAAVAKGWPRTMTLNRPSSDLRRAKLLTAFSTIDGRDRDEYPAAVGRGRGAAILRIGGDPIGWVADVAYVPSAENRSHGARLGNKLRRFCDGVRFRYVFR